MSCLPAPLAAQSHSLLTGSCPHPCSKGRPCWEGGLGGLLRLLPCHPPTSYLRSLCASPPPKVWAAAGPPTSTHTKVLTWATQACAWTGGVDVHYVHTALGLLALERRRHSVSRSRGRVAGTGQAEGGVGRGDTLSLCPNTRGSSLFSSQC